MDVIAMWWISLAIAGIVIVVVAILLGLVIAAAKRIDRHAHAIWIEGKQIAGNTVSIWMLEKILNNLRKMESDLVTMQQGVESMDDHVRGMSGSGSGRS